MYQISGINRENLHLTGSKKNMTTPMSELKTKDFLLGESPVAALGFHEVSRTAATLKDRWGFVITKEW